MLKNMFAFFKKTWKLGVIGALISCSIMLRVFFATDGLLGNKEFSEYTQHDWSCRNTSYNYSSFGDFYLDFFVTFDNSIDLYFPFFAALRKDKI